MCDPYGDLLSHVLNNGDVADVTVNQRALVDKILARYSSEFTVYRELLQNSDDAESSEVEIEFCSGDSPAPALHSDPNCAHLPPCHSIIYRNNGLPFNDDSWKRVTVIAEGNPDPEKFGFFGVGLLSIFSLCDQPLILSGEKVMAFLWEENQLHTRSCKNSAESRWTIFSMKLRETLPFPHLQNFEKFLSNCLAFTRHLSKISVLYNFTKILELEKKVATSYKTNFCLNQQSHSFLSLFLPSESKDLQSPSGLFSLKDTEMRELHLTSTFFLSPEEPKQKSVDLRMGLTTASVNADRKLISEIERVTKKIPPSQLCIQLLYGGCAAVQDHFSLALKPEGEDTTTLAKTISFLTSIFSSTAKNQIKIPSKESDDLLSTTLPLSGHGKVFIGFSTHQTTGAGYHLSSAFYPTVERENVDFVDPALARWNKELLFACGMVARLIYEEEFIRLSIPGALLDAYQNWRTSELLASHYAADGLLSSDNELFRLRNAVLDSASFLSSTFHHRVTTPSEKVGEYLRSGFFCSSLPSLAVFTTNGVRMASQSKLPYLGLGALCLIPTKLCETHSRCHPFNIL
jgi:hypothetical protein